MRINTNNQGTPPHTGAPSPRPPAGTYTAQGRRVPPSATGSEVPGKLAVFSAGPRGEGPRVRRLSWPPKGRRARQWALRSAACQALLPTLAGEQASREGRRASLTTEPSPILRKKHNTTPGIHVNRPLDPFQMDGSKGFQGRRDTLSTPPFIRRTSYFSKKHTHFCSF